MLNRDGDRVVRRWIGFGILMGVAVASGCHAPARIEGPVHAIWVTRYDYKTADDVQTIVNNCADAGFNTILFQVRGNGTAFYRSPLEPWADELGGRDPGYDPLQVACQTAHAREVQLHAYVNALPAWRGKTPPSNPEQLYNKHPDWFWYDQYGKRQALSSFYVSLNPCLPEVRRYIVDVFRDLVTRYDVDGLHLDYIRFPNEPPAIPSGTDIDYPRDARTLELYRQATGKAPDDDKESWNQWRTDQVTQLVADIHNMVQRTKPGVVVTASVGSVRANSLKHFQDAQAWIDQGSVDGICLMNYTSDPQVFSDRMDPWLDKNPGFPVIPGLWFGDVSEKRPIEQQIEQVKCQIDLANERAGHYCVFAYANLFDSPNLETTQQGDKEATNRAWRREEILPLTQSLAK